MKVICTYRTADGVKRRFLRDYSTGVVVEGAVRSRPIRPSDGNYYQVSSSNGVPSRQVAQAEAVDRQLGVPIKYLKDGPLAYAAFDSRRQKQKWLKAHRRVDHDAGCGDPAPGDFVGR